MSDGDCFGQVQSCAQRYTRLNPDGSPKAGTGNLYVSKALTTFTIANVYRDGTEIEEPSACGETAVYFLSPKTYKRIDWTLELVRPDPLLMPFFAGARLFDALVSEQSGFAAPPLGVIDADPISIELWARRVDDGKQDATEPWAWWVIPFANNISIGDLAIGNAAIKPTFAGQGYENENWGDGPTNDFPAESDKVFQWFPTADIPTPSCELQDVAAS